MRDFAWLTILQLVILVGVIAFAGTTHQLFIDTDGNPATGYGPTGAELLIDVEGQLRETVTDGYMSPAGWGARAEFYEAGEWIGSCHVPLRIHVLQDADLDGDVDLRDFAEFQRLFTGPR